MSGIYLHIPFCHSKCAYCDFFSTPRRYDTSAFVDAVIAEYEARSHELSGTVNTIYFGGGTPSSLPLPDLQRLLRYFAPLKPEEFTIEVNPEDVTPQLAAMLLDEGVNRVSMGVQTLDDEILRFIGRRHTARQALDAVDTLRAAGVDNLSLDLIYGLPDQSLDSWKQSLDGVLRLHPEHLSCYALSYEPGTRLSAMLAAGKIQEPPESLSEAMYSHLCRRAADAGLDHYEIANFSLPGRHSRHNAAYWDFTPYLGLGPGAHSFDGNIRRYNPHRITEYIASPTDFAQIDEETPDERFNDYVMTALRTSAGIDLQLAEHLFGASSAQRLRRLAAPHLASGRMLPTPRGFRIAEASWLMADPITIDLFI